MLCWRQSEAAAVPCRPDVQKQDEHDNYCSLSSPCCRSSGRRRRWSPRPTRGGEHKEGWRDDTRPLNCSLSGDLSWIWEAQTGRGWGRAKDRSENGSRSESPDLKDSDGENKILQSEVRSYGSRERLFFGLLSCDNDLLFQSCDKNKERLIILFSRDN